MEIIKRLTQRNEKMKLAKTLITNPKKSVAIACFQLIVASHGFIAFASVASFLIRGSFTS